MSRKYNKQFYSTVYNKEIHHYLHGSDRKDINCSLKVKKNSRKKNCAL